MNTAAMNATKEVHVPPLSIDGVGQVSDVESNDRDVDVCDGFVYPRVWLRELVDEPERDGESETDEDREGEHVVWLAVGEAINNALDTV